MAQRIRVDFAAMVLTVCVLFLTGCGVKPEPAEIALTAEATERSISVRWDAVDGSDRCRLFRKGREENDFRFICDVTEAAAYTDEYLEQGIEYVYKLKVYDGSEVIAEGLCEPVGLLASPRITAICQIGGETFEVEWEHHDRECVVYGKNASGWFEIGRSEEGLLRFENTEKCTELSVSSAGEDAIRSEAVSFCGSCSILAVTPLDSYTNVVELDAPNGEWRYELARSETKDGAYTIVGSADDSVFYDTMDTENTIPCWYRFRCFGERFEGAWSEPMQLGTNARDVFYVPVILYHEFLPEDELDSAEFNEDVITPGEFESDLIWLKEHGYSSITTADLAEYLEGGAALPEKPVILSIDDGKYSVYKWAWPLVMKYGMQGSLAVIGSMIDSATEAPQARENSRTPYCTWDEIKEMHDSGAMEIISHTQSMHVFSHDGRQGADCAPGETMEQFLPSAESDAKVITDKIEQLTGSTVVSMAYPYSLRSSEADRAWLGAGYKLLLCGNKDTVHNSKWNPMIREAGLNGHSALLRRIARISGTSVGKYLDDYEELLAERGLKR